MRVCSGRRNDLKYAGRNDENVTTAKRDHPATRTGHLLQIVCSHYHVILLIQRHDDVTPLRQPARHARLGERNDA